MQMVKQDSLVIRRYEHGSDDDRKGYLLRHDILNLAPGVGDAAVQFVFGCHDKEADQIKLGAFSEDCMVGTVNLAPQPDGTVLLRQFAVTTKLQGMGIGKKLLAYAHTTAKELGYTRVMLDARQNVAEFYAKAGYIRTGKKLVYPEIVLEQMYIDL